MWPYVSGLCIRYPLCLMAFRLDKTNDFDWKVDQFRVGSIADCFLLILQPNAIFEHNYFYFYLNFPPRLWHGAVSKSMIILMRLSFLHFNLRLNDFTSDFIHGSSLNLFLFDYCYFSDLFIPQFSPNYYLVVVLHCFRYC